MTARDILGVVGIAVRLIFNGYVLSLLWSWFVVPTFGAPVLNFVPAIGIAMVISHLTHQIHDCKKEERSFNKEIIRVIVIAIGKPSLTLFFGWVVHLFM